MAALKLRVVSCRMKFAFRLPRNITSMPRKPRALLIFPRDSFRWMFTRAEGSDRGKEKKKRKREKECSLYSSHDAFCHGKLAGGLETADRETRKSREEKREREREGKKVPEYHRVIDYRRGIALLLLRTTVLRNIAKRMPRRLTADAIIRTNKCRKESRLTAINMRMLEFEPRAIRWTRYVCMYASKNRARQKRKNSITKQEKKEIEGKKRIEIFPAAGCCAYQILY